MLTVWLVVHINGGDWMNRFLAECLSQDAHKLCLQLFIPWLPGAVTRSPGVTLLWHHLRLFKLHHERSKLLQEVKVVYFILCLHITSHHPPGLVTQSKDQIHSRCCQDRWKPAVCDIIHGKLKKPWTRHSPCPCILFLWNEYNRRLRQGEGGELEAELRRVINRNQNRWKGVYHEEMKE